MKPVFVFKTSVSSHYEVGTLKPRLDKLMGQGDRWNFDLEDCDNILRVETDESNIGIISETLKVEGYYCEELQ